MLPLGSATREIRKDSLSSVRAQFVPVIDTLRHSMSTRQTLRSTGRPTAVMGYPVV